MAYSKVVTTVANPARKKQAMAKRKFSAKQIRAGFGGKRRKAAMKTKRHAPAAKRRNPSKARRRKPARRRNTGEILVLTAGNPAKKGKAMAKKSYHRRKTKAGAKHRTNAGRRSTTTHRKHHYSSRRRSKNPGAIGRPMDWVKGGVGVIAGGVGTRLIPQLVLPANNTGPTGYAMNAGAAVLLAWGTHAVTKDKVLTAAVAAGGFAALILRIVNDQSSVGKYLALSGMGDYMVSNWTAPQRITDPRGAMFEMGGGGAAMMPAAQLQRAGEDGSGNC